METGITPLTPELLALIGNGGVTALAPFSREIYLLSIVVAGTSFCETIGELEPQLVEGTALRMIRQPDNNYDDQAIGIFYNTTRVGWVPMEENPVISRLMDAGKAFFCRIESTSRKGKWVKIKAAVYMVE
ncbi:MAG: HIRAN domain-containing protein [Paludibacter sp.]|nr:HIRAN domain-containing protein [Paludibacter sp.]